MEDKRKLQEIVKDRLEEKFPDFEKGWNAFTKKIGAQFVETISDYFTKGNFFMKALLPDSLTIVVDNNIVFGQIQKAVLEKSPLEDSFIYKLCKLTFIQINAPYKLKEELIAKINLHIVESNELALQYADRLLEMITIQDAQWTDEWKKANNLIGETDRDDVPYLALAFQERSHAIISYDKVFQKQGEVQIWNMQDAGKIISNYYSGVISLVLVGSSSFLITYFLKIVMLVIKKILDFLLAIIDVVAFLLKKGIQALSSVHPIILLIIVVSSIAVYRNNEDFKKFIDELFKKGVTAIIDLYKIIINQVKSFYALFEELLAATKPTLLTSFELIGYVSMEYHLLMAMVDDLEKKRPK